MQAARLIKRGQSGEPLAAQGGQAESPVPHRPAAETVVNWIKNNRQSSQPSARERFEALFAQPQS